MLKEIENLKNQVEGKIPVTSCHRGLSKVCKSKDYACDAISIPLPLRNNAFVHSEYLRYLKDCIDMLCETIEEVRMIRPTDDSIRDVHYLTNRSYELLDYAIGTCPKVVNKQDRNKEFPQKVKNKHVTFKVPLTSSDPNTKVIKNQTVVHH